MARIMKKSAAKVGLDPGTLVHIGERRTERAAVRRVVYDAQRLEEHAEEREPPAAPAAVTWIAVDGLHEPSLIESLGDRFGINRLHLEDILNTNQRPKLEVDEGYLFLTLKVIGLKPAGAGVAIEQCSVILGRNSVLSFHEQPGDIFEEIRRRLRNDGDRLRKQGADALFHALVDSIVDQYYVVFEHLDEVIERAEREMLESESPVNLRRVHELKRDVLLLRRSIWPLRELSANLLHTGSPLITKQGMIYLRDLHDHTAQMSDALETYREMLDSLQMLHWSLASARMNAVIKVLTVITTIFIPLTFIAGVYGMNFRHMPELEWEWGYRAVIGLMLGVAVVMLIVMRRKKWL